MIKKIGISIIALIGITELAKNMFWITNRLISPHLMSVTVNFIWLATLWFSDNGFNMIFSDVITIIVLAIIFVFTKENLIKRCRFKKFSPKKIPVIFFLVLGLIFIIIGGMGLISKFVMVHYSGINDNFVVMGRNLLGITTLVLLVPICEEIIFRGALFSVLRKRLPIVLVVILQGAAWAYFHGDIVQIIYVFPMGLVLGFIYLYTDSIIATMMGHILNNLINSSILGVALYSLHLTNIEYIIVGAILMLCAYPYHLKFVKKKNDKVSLKFA